MILVMAWCKNYLYGPDTFYNHMPYNTQVFPKLCNYYITPNWKKKKKAEKTAIIYGNGQSQSDHYTGQKLLLNKTKEFTIKNLENIGFK